MEFKRGEMPLSDFAKLVDAVNIARTPASQDDLRRELVQWAANAARRDDLVRAALAADIPKSEIHDLSGIARSTIDRIADDAPRPSPGIAP